MLVDTVLSVLQTLISQRHILHKVGRLLFQVYFRKVKKKQASRLAPESRPRPPEQSGQVRAVAKSEKEHTPLELTGESGAGLVKKKLP